MAKHIYGMHDPGEWTRAVGEAGVTAWCVYTREIGADPSNLSGEHFGAQSITPIARLNHGYGTTGTIPLPEHYGDFARRCANFVKASTGCTRWIIGNEISMQWEFPNGRPIQLDEYVQCFRLCREMIKAVRPEAEVIPQPPTPWNANLCYTGNERGDWVKQLSDMLTMIGSERVDGIAIHAYTHGHDAALVSSEEKMSGAPFTDRRYQFRVYQDFMDAIPSSFRGLPVYITEANGCGWNNQNNGWVQSAYAEIDQWNRSGRQKIYCLCLYRWSAEDIDTYCIMNKPGVVDDFRQALTRRFEIPMTNEQVYVTAPSGLNLRMEPNTQSNVIELLPINYQLAVIERVGDWAHVMAGARDGWVHADYIDSRPVRTQQSGDVADYTVRAAAQYNLDPALARAVLRVESAGHGIVNGRLLTRFEPRVWLTMTLPEALRQTGKMLFAFGSRPQDDRISLSGTWKEFHGNQEMEHLALALACAVDRKSALGAASYGLAQIMGFNAQSVGYADSEAMVAAFAQSEEAQASAFFAYCANRKDASGSALDALRARDFRRFAQMYNGHGQEDLYAGLIQKALETSS